ncbi:hypothetical protein [Burkholderia sp. SRS-W-2-2016]|uniref:hypothetical protein n=1 Tax=Burkholderia sp. SRS-W-2-2016 TaxID=1926878 RepID=UPI0011801620
MKIRPKTRTAASVLAAVLIGHSAFAALHKEPVIETTESSSPPWFARTAGNTLVSVTLPPTLLPRDMNAANSIKAEAGGFKPARYSFPDATVPRSVLHNLTRVYAYDRRRDVPIVSSAGDWVIAEYYLAGSHIPRSRFRLLGDQVQRQEELDRTGRTTKIIAIGWAPRTAPDDDAVDTSELGEHPAWIRVFSVSPSRRKTLVAIAWRTKRFATASAADRAPDDRDLVFGLPDGEVRWQTKNAFLKANNIDLGARKLSGMAKAAKS